MNEQSYAQTTQMILAELKTALNAVDPASVEQLLAAVQQADQVFFVGVGRVMLALEAIARADLILLGPGSLYTSVIPNLLVDGIADAIADAPALRAYVCNVMTQDGETEGYTAADHLRAILTHSGHKLVDFCLVNSEPMPEELLPLYAKENAVPITVDPSEIAAMGVALEERPLADVRQRRLARHDPELLAQAAMQLVEEHTVRVVKNGSPRYVRER